MRRCREELEAEQAQAHAAYEENLRWRAEWEAEHARKLGGRKPSRQIRTRSRSARSTRPTPTRD
jgi:hypothetical protein